MAQDDHLRDLVAEVAAAYFSNSHVSPSDIPAVVQQIAASLAAVGAEPSAAPENAPTVVEEPVQKKLTPAQIRKSITHEGLISFEDGKLYKTLKRHLTTKGLTLTDYRAKWGLPKDYPSVAPAYSAARSAMAKALGLGQMRKTAAAAPAPAAPAPKPRGRKPKATAPAA